MSLCHLDFVVLVSLFVGLDSPHLFPKGGSCDSNPRSSYLIPASASHWLWPEDVLTDCVQDTHDHPCIPKPGSIPACFSAFAFRPLAACFSLFCSAASARTTSASANFSPLGLSSLSRSTVAQMVTFSPRMVMTPGHLTSQASHGVLGSDAAFGLRAAMRSEHSVRTRLAVGRYQQSDGRGRG